MIDKILERLRQEKSIIVILILSALSCIFVHVSDFTSYFDTYTTGLWFSAMTISAGLSANGVFGRFTARVINKVSDTRAAAFALVFMTFFAAPFLTDAAAVAFFAPLTVSLLSFSTPVLMYVLSLEAAAANLGAMIFPAASVHNLFLYSKYHLTYGRYVRIIFPLYAAGIIILALFCLMTKRLPIENRRRQEEKSIESPYYVVIYVTLFLLDVFAVLGAVSMLTVFASVCLAVVIMEPEVFSEVDYTRLILLAGMFILIGNITEIKELTAFIGRIFSGEVYESAILSSQIAGNLPAAMFFSLFSHSPSDMIISANIGSLGLVYASSAGMCARRIGRERLVSDSVKLPVYYFASGIVIGILLYLAYRFIFPIIK